MDRIKDLIGWSILFLSLFVSSFGFSTFHLSVVSLISFFGGILTVLHFAYNKEIKGYYHNDLLNNPLKETNFSVDLVKVLKDFRSSENSNKFDQRITGSETLDAFLNEIFNIIISDYVTNWYQVITAEDEFVNFSLKQTVLATSVNLSNRIKSVDWTPFITKRILEEITTHIKIFKQARVRMKQLKMASTENLRNTSKQTSKKFPQDEKTSVHKRNKSDTDVTWYPERQKYGNSKFYSSNLETIFESIFFEMEKLLEEKGICRDAVCLDPEKENELLCELSEAVLYMLAPPETWECNSLKFIITDLLASVVLRPLISLLSDPDNINRLIIRLCCGDTNLSGDLFLNVLRSSDDVEELTAIYDLIQKEILKLHSRDSSGECELWVRQQLSSLKYLKRTVHSRRSTLAPSEYLNTHTMLTTASSQEESTDGMRNEEMDDKVKDVLRLLEAISDWRASAQSQLEGTLTASGAILEKLQSSALELCGRHQLTSALPLGVTDDIVQTLLDNIHYQHLDPMSWFTNLQNSVVEALEDEELTNEDMWRCQPRPELFADFDYTQAQAHAHAQATTSQAIQTEQQRDGDGTSLPDCDEPVKCRVSHSRCVMKSCLLRFNSIFHKSSNNYSCTSHKSYTLPRRSSASVGTSKSNTFPKRSHNHNLEAVEGINQSVLQPNLLDNSSELTVRIIETGLMQEKSRSFGIYAVAVSREMHKRKEVWHVYRRYRDFHDLHCTVKEKWPELANLPFPGKKTFQNTSRSVLERRMLVLDAYLNSLVNLARQPAYTALLATPLLGTFLCPHDNTDSHNNTTIDGVLVNSIKAGMRSLKNMPDQFANTVDGVMDGISKAFQGKFSNDTGCYDSNELTTNVDSQDSADDMGVALRLLEEVLGLRGLWLRRRLLAPLRTIIADRVNKKVLEYVSSATSPKNVVQYLKFFRERLSLRGKIGDSVARSTSEQARARLAAKVALLYACPDEIKHVVGAETSRRGLLMLFSLFQHRDINKRLILVLLQSE